MTKKCNGCGKELPLSQFNKNKNNKDNLSYYCKKCTKEQKELYFYNQGNEHYEKVILNELKLYPQIQINGIDYNKVLSTRICLYDLPGILNNLLDDLPNFLMKYDLSFEEYKFIVQQCKDNKFVIKPKDLNR
ncbi:MAG: hypothetical protein IKF82_00010 [Bacilli bacterium]|nr:hypothetical protein [Bacilli bacterium]